jgi:hypothetical protein
MSFARIMLDVAIALALTNSGAAEDLIAVRAGELVRCTLEEPNLSSATVDVGDPVVCYLQSFREFGVSVFPRGSFLSGRVSDWREPGRFAGKGWLALSFDRLILGTSLEVPISAKVVGIRNFKVDGQGKTMGKGHARRDVLAWSLPPFWAYQIIKLPGRGPRPTLQGETPVVVRMLDDVVVPDRSYYLARPSRNRPTQDGALPR